MAKQFDLLVSDGLYPAGLELLKKSGLFRLDVRDGVSQTELLEILPRYDGIVLHVQTKLTCDVIEKAAAGRLRYIGCASVGFDHCDVETATKLGVRLDTAAGGNAQSVGDLALGLMLSLARSLPQAYNSLAAGKWEKKSFQGFALEEKVLGLLGTGHTGKATAQRAQGFGMKVVAYDPLYLPGTRTPGIDEYLSSKEDVLARADIVSVHVPLQADTMNLLGEKDLRAMKPGSFVINTARGGIVNEEAMERLLDEGHIAGYGADVFETEPLPAEHWIRKHPRVIMTPHLGGATHRARTGIAEKIAQSTIAFFQALK